MAGNETFETMLEGAFSGDGEKFDELYRFIYHAAYKVTRNHHAAEDAAMKVLEKLWHEWQVETVHDRSKLRAWMLQVTRNEAVDYLRKLRSDLSLDLVEDVDESPLRDFLVTECSLEIPEVHAERQESQKFIQQALSSVSEISRSCLILRLIEKKSLEEIAALHQRSPRQIQRYIREGKDEFLRAYGRLIASDHEGEEFAS